MLFVLGWIDARKMVVSEYMLYAWTEISFQVQSVGVITPCWLHHGTWI